jgi:hypothetical protein
MYNCETTNPAQFFIYPAHCVMSWYYVSMLPKMIASRNKELSQIKKGGLKLQWFTPIPDEKIK